RREEDRWRSAPLFHRRRQGRGAATPGARRRRGRPDRRGRAGVRGRGGGGGRWTSGALREFPAPRGGWPREPPRGAKKSPEQCQRSRGRPIPRGHATTSFFHSGSRKGRGRGDGGGAKNRRKTW